MKFISGLQYRAAAWAGIATQFAWGFMLIMIYRAFYRSSSAAPPMEWPQLVAYIWLQQSLLAFWMLWGQDETLLSDIRDGQIAYELCRPYDLYSYWYARLIGMRLANVSLRFAPLLIVASLLPQAYRLTLPPSFGASAMFIVTLALGMLLIVAVSMFIYILTFVTLTPTGAKIIVAVASDFLGGHIIPIPFLPKWLQRVSDFLPFRYASDLPLRLYSGNISGADALTQIAIQLVWIVGLILLGRLAFGRVMRNVTVQGG
jgi:ABC-2 type transport system permease protein